MTTHVKISNGSYRNQTVKEAVFPMVKPFKWFNDQSKGGFITVDGSAYFGVSKNKIRVNVSNPGQLQLGTAEQLIDDSYVPPEPPAEKTDEERIAEIAERFEMLDEITGAVMSGAIRSVILSGPPGVGKSYGVTKQIEPYLTADYLMDTNRATIISGNISAVGLYCELYKYRESNCVVVFDDVDAIFFDQNSLNVLKAVLNSGDSRKVSWMADSNTLKAEGIPNQFDFRGNIIFITNLDFENVRSTQLKPHLEALQSRCHYLDLTISTMRDKLLRIKQIAATGQLFADYDFTADEESAIIGFMEDNCENLREVSLRMAIKIAQLFNSFPNKWQAMAKATCTKG